MVTISLCMIVRNEEKTLERCLSSVMSAVDEIVVADTGSSDRTKEVASRFTGRIFDFPWADDFSDARNFSFEKAAMDYILWLDADDLLLPCDAVKLRALKESLDPETDAVLMRYNTGFDGRGRVVFSYGRERLVKRSRGFRWKEPVHEYLEIFGRTADSDICVTHARQKGREAGRNLRIYEKFLAEGKSLSPRGMYYYARELKDGGRYGEAAIEFRRFLDSGKGWKEDNIQACGELAGCLLALGKEKDALLSMLESFSYDTPRAELCCRIGYYFKDRNRFREAAFWFELALGLEKPAESRGFFQSDFWGYIPCLECAVCCDRLGEYEKAERFNERASEYKPDSQQVVHNRNYFTRRRTLQNELCTGGLTDAAADVSGHQP